MDLKEYSIEVQRTLSVLDTAEKNDFHMVLGMVTEAGELADAFKKNLAYGKPIDWVNVKEEIGDLMWYVANFCVMHGFDLEEIFQITIDKLKIRYPEKFTSESAINRNLDKERKVLEGRGRELEIITELGYDD